MALDKREEWKERGRGTGSQTTLWLDSGQSAGLGLVDKGFLSRELTTPSGHMKGEILRSAFPIGDQESKECSDPLT